MVKRKEIIKQIKHHAKQNNKPIKILEGGNHARIWIGDRYTTLPRHTEIPDNFAKKILKQIGVE